MKRKKKNNMQVVGNANNTSRKGSCLCRVERLLHSSWEEWCWSSPSGTNQASILMWIWGQTKWKKSPQKKNRIIEVLNKELHGSYTREISLEKNGVTYINLWLSSENSSDWGMACLHSVLTATPCPWCCGDNLCVPRAASAHHSHGKRLSPWIFPPVHWPHSPGAFGVCSQPILPGESQQQPRSARGREWDLLSILPPFLGITSPGKSAPRSALNSCVCRGLGRQLFILSFLHLPPALSQAGPASCGHVYSSREGFILLLSHRLWLDLYM